MLDKDAVLRMVKLYTNIRNEIGQDDYLSIPDWITPPVRS